MNTGSSSNAMGNQKALRSISYALVFLMMVCVIMTIGSLIQNMSPDGHAGMIAGVMLFIVVDRLYTYKQLKSLTFLSSEWATAIGVQWIVIALFIRLLLSYANGLEAFSRDLSLFARGDVERILSPEYVLTLMLALMLWYLPTPFLELLDELGLDQELALRDETIPIQGEAVPAHRRLVNLIFSVGIAIVLLTALARINLQATFSNGSSWPHLELNQLSGEETGAILYFVFGLTLLSVSRLMSLQTHWNRQRIPVSSSHLARQWAIHSLVFLVILALVVSLLPAGDSLGFFSILRTLVGFVLSVFMFLAQVIVALLLILFSLPFLLFGKAPPFNPAGAPPPMPTLPVQTDLPDTPSAIWALIRSILLWGALAVIIVYSLVYFLRQHDGILGTLRKSRIARWLRLAWKWFYGNVEKTRGSLSTAIVDGWQRIVSRLRARRVLLPPNWISVRLLDPRRQIYFFYLAMIRRGAEQGLQRGPSQTPSEYAVTLERALPSSIEDIDSITEAFVKARYSRHEVSSNEAALVKNLWARIRRALKDRSKSG